MTPEQSQRYGGLVQAITAQAASFTDSGLSADAAAKVLAKAVTARKPRTRYTIGRTTAVMTPIAPFPHPAHRTGHADFPAPGSRTRPHAFVHGTACPSRVRRTSPKVS